MELRKFNGLGRALSRSEMKQIRGGVAAGGGSGTCAIYSPSGQIATGVSYSADCASFGQSVSINGISLGQAQALTNGISGAHYCCDHCSTASWYQPCASA